MQMHALVLEDELILATLWQDVLDLSGIKVTVETRLEDARAAVLENTYDIYIMDYLIGQENSGELIETIMQKAPDTPVLVVTGAETKAILEETPVLKKVDHVLQKPVDAVKLRDLICGILGLSPTT